MDTPALFRSIVLRRYRYLFVLLAALLLQACEPSAERRAELVEIHLKQAKAYIKSGQYRAATIEAKNVIQKAPEDGRGYAMLGKILVELGQYKSALMVLDQAPAGQRSMDDFATRIEALLGRGKFATALAEIGNNAAFVDKRP
ncbi:MAG: hypothetical protein HKO71_04820, partial [Pseudomonadales bacterium]|nr:hypothetical protein [Pseudomonadales bacterium]